MKGTLWLMVAALPLCAQPKLLTNAKVDTRSASAGLDQIFRAALNAQPQPAWIGYAVPSTRTYNLGCDYVNRSDFNQAGVVHLEPPDQAVILFRVEANTVDRIRALSPDCEIDAGGVPMHWLSDVQPAQSVALLATFVDQHMNNFNGALSAIAMHADPAADQMLDKYVAADQLQSLRLRAISSMGNQRGRHGFEAMKNLIANDRDEKVRERAVQTLANSKEPEAVDLLISIARTDKDARVRSQAVGELARKPGPKVLNTLTGALADPDEQVQRRAVTALQQLPDGQGIPLLIQVVKTTRNDQLRKQAMNSLKNSQDPRALSFFEDVLK
ncbi:PBS lyase HEAT domain protein repeat-containing protein [Candidatus Sulfopaludibacter sp. SbA3]|nr:PBS lyase HEAT domain protein repeat-containing protein [Candidatus Sulfopaludibacter sp. SbA3]